MYRPIRRLKKTGYMPKPELVPVLDAMFVMIFFILSTAEFLKISEIGSDLPVMRLSVDENPEKRKLILKMMLSPQKITLVNDVNNTELFTSPLDDNAYQRLNAKVEALKSEYPTEEKVMVYSDLTTKYEVLIKALDAVRQTERSGIKVKLFNQIIFR